MPSWNLSIVTKLNHSVLVTNDEKHIIPMNNLQFCHSFWLSYIIFYDFAYFGGHFGRHLGFLKMATKPNYQKLVTNDQEPNPNDYFSNLPHF